MLTLVRLFYLNKKIIQFYFLACDLSNVIYFRPLHISARNGLVDVTRQLLNKGASVFAMDNEGLTPALCCAPNLNVAHCLALILQSLPQFKDCTGLGTGKFFYIYFQKKNEIISRQYGIIL